MQAAFFSEADRAFLPDLSLAQYLSRYLRKASLSENYRHRLAASNAAPVF